MDWLACPTVEQIPAKMSGVPVIKHSRVRPEDLIANCAEGEDWLADALDLPLATVRQILAFYIQHEVRLAPSL